MSLDAREIERILGSELPEARITVEGGEGKYRVQIVDEMFHDLSPVKRQQAVYKILNEYIASGAIHAVSMDLKTRDETGSD